MTAVEVQSRQPTPDGRFRVIVDGAWMEEWTLDRIKRAVAEGVRLTERSAR